MLRTGRAGTDLRGSNESTIQITSFIEIAIFDRVEGLRSMVLKNGIVRRWIHGCFLLHQIFIKLYGLGGRGDAEFVFEEALHVVVVFLDGGGFALGGEDAEGEAVEIFAVGVEREDLAGVFEGAVPLLVGDCLAGEPVDDAGELLLIKASLFLGPVVIRALEKISAI